MASKLNYHFVNSVRNSVSLKLESETITYKDRSIFVTPTKSKFKK